ncbi:hypothetical protein CIAN88_09830 [[Clostridium] innocuum]|uniref:Uncharacterized protein n=1 Tax=Clostridium innocuum TaxID=1522 RepID=A0A099I8Y6_CLOIN|nr:hypothetical protein CIAN88_09830 [[Clostridium] innocuum]
MLNTNSCSAAFPYRIETGYFMKLYQNGERKLITGVNHHSHGLRHFKQEAFSHNEKKVKCCFRAGKKACETQAIVKAKEKRRFMISSSF